MKTVWTIPLIAACVFVLDAVSKSWALAHLQAGTLTPFIPHLIQLTLTTNTGGAFGIGHDIKGLMTFLPLVICGALVYWIAKREKTGAFLTPLEQIGFALVLGGALGNISDRLVRGRVTDFIDFAFMDFPIFNVADALIDVGVALIIIHAIVTKGPDQDKSSGETNG